MRACACARSLLDIIATAQGSSCYLVLECCDCDLVGYMAADPAAAALPRIKVTAPRHTVPRHA